MIRAGVIGLGVGEQHALAYQALPGVELRAVADIDPIHLEGVADRLKVARRFTEWRKVTEDPDIDVVSICSWDDAHAEQAISAFENGKHVMVEKPLCLNRQDAERVLRAQQDSGKRITSNLILRRHPPFMELRRQIQAREFGHIDAVGTQYIHDIFWKVTHGWRSRMPGYSVIYGGGIHMIDLVRWLFEQEVDAVGALTGDEPMVVNFLVFDDFCASVATRFNGPGHFHMVEISGTERSYTHDQPARVAKGALIPDFIAAIRENRAPEVSARDVFRVMDICFACVEAVEQRKTVTVSYQI